MIKLSFQAWLLGRGFCSVVFFFGEKCISDNRKSICNRVDCWWILLASQAPVAISWRHITRFPRGLGQLLEMKVKLFVLFLFHFVL